MINIKKKDLKNRAIKIKTRLKPEMIKRDRKA